MTRKTIMGFAVAVMIAVALAIAFGTAEEKGEMILTYAGVSANDSNRVVFTVTNTSRVALAWYVHTQIMSKGSGAEPAVIEMAGNKMLKGSSASTFEAPALFDKRWRLAVWYDRPISDSFVSRWRGKCIHFVDDRAWYQLENWLQPSPKMLWAYGPEMLGNKPAPPGPK